jgi:hypothetical protein
MEEKIICHDLKARAGQRDPSSSDNEDDDLVLHF